MPSQNNKKQHIFYYTFFYGLSSMLAVNYVIRYTYQTLFTESEQLKVPDKRIDKELILKELKEKF